MKKLIKTIDGNEAAAYIAYRTNEVCAIYPITPSSTMAELCDEWSAKSIKNIWGNVPDVIEMQSEGGAAGTVHGALQTGALTTTFTASQGLMLMLPNMYKIAGELTATVFHVAARSLAAQGLSIFGDHSDVMAARTTGFAMLASANVQEAHDFALIAQAATMQSRIPFIHFFDGFRTSHEVSKINLMSDEVISSMIDNDLLFAHRLRALNPDNPFIRGTAQNPDVYFQARETVNPFYAQTPGIVQQQMDKLGSLTGRFYKLFEYYGKPDAERIIIMMASGAETATETIKKLMEDGEKVGVINVRLFRPFSVKHLIDVLPASVKKVAVLDRTKEPGADGEPLYKDIITAFTEAYNDGQLTHLPRIVGGRYGLSSKEFTPAMVKGIFEELKKDVSKNHFTIGINDDVSNSSLDYDPSFELEDEGMTAALFYGLGADGTVSANKNSIKIIGENTDLFAQGYFVYDSKKSGSQTVSHLRFGKNPIKAPYLVEKADFIACHQFNFIQKIDILQKANPGSVFLLNSPYSSADVWGHLPAPIQQQLIDKKIKLYVIDADEVAQNAGMGNRINTIMQTCFFALSGVLPREEAISQIKQAIEKTYSKKGKAVIDLNFKAVDAALSHLHEVLIPLTVTAQSGFPDIVPQQAPDFVQNVTAVMMKGEGDQLPVSMLPIDGTYPSGTTQWEKRNVSDTVPVWDPVTCIQCGNCSFVCPHGVIRAKFYNQECLEDAPEGFPSANISARGFPETRYTLQIYAEDCTGCTLCVDACPAFNLADNTRKAINMEAKAPILDKEKENIKFFESLPVNDRSKVDFSSVRGAQFLEPLFEFSGACAGCGETPYVKLLTQLFGDRLIVANATGCSSIYGGNLPTTPWTKNKDGKGPAWSNSLFEDNAEFGLGMRVSADKQLGIAQDLLKRLSSEIDNSLIEDILNAPQLTESQIMLQRMRVQRLKEALKRSSDPFAKHLLYVADHFVRRSVWLLGGDGWAYDIGSSGLDHVLASGRNVNVLVMDTEVYSNTGGQSSKSTPMAATAKFATAGKRVGKKNLALQAISYGNVYVAQVAMGGNPQQTLLAMRQAEAYEGPSLILAYSHCIAHGIDMAKGLQQQKLAVNSAYWPLFRFNPKLRQKGINPFILDSPRPTIQLKDYALNEMRYKNLEKNNPAEAKHLMEVAQQLVDLRWNTYENMAQWKAEEFAPVL
ncbi:pyruvate:ferredoxin (flavodoxin) oxidoreductase [Chitinophagaceae bacterium LB-8]|uniref:Pyruvate:ferredoxin (Flavodoxin) oxidoreductase n=1 Tax=Paraflavisolibacter caeni TaxID=2982496 RepID=A0A9X2XW76_9BACT|nr:pyruvate:ferredoxin (flavodoxin) oxidoreductase [Paraflavisolibacter caeni]MCU7550361.1 pyruvate:ferredoxin (flavodoxin) oxidoreductase [Paraflavisolibacter caeni]